MYKLCTPAMVYVVLAGISILLALFSKFHAFSILTKIVFVGAWTWFLNYLCMKGYKAISWFLVLLPFLVMLGIFALAAEIVNVASKQVLPPSYHREGLNIMYPGKKDAGTHKNTPQTIYGKEGLIPLKPFPGNNGAGIHTSNARNNCNGLTGTALSNCNARNNGF